MAEDADIKISEMGEAPLPLSGTELITLVTNNKNYKSNISNIRDLFSSGGDLNYDSSTGAFSVTTFKTDDARNSISINNDGGDGSLSYDSTTGVITYNGPTASEVRSHFSSGTGIDLSSGGVISVDSEYIDQSLLTTDDVDFSSVTINENYVFDSDTVTTDSTSQEVLTSFDSTVYRGGKFIIQAIRGTDSQISELLVLHDESEATSTEYGIIYTSASEIFSTDVDIDNNNVRILVTSSSEDNTRYKVLSSLMFGNV